MKNIKNYPLRSGVQLLGRYTIVKHLASGGFGVVYLARTQQGASVALKEFLPSMISCRIRDGVGDIECQNPAEERYFKKGVRAFFEEADLVARIKDPRIVDILDVFEANGTVYYVMPLEQGETLQRRVQREKVLSDAQIQRFFIEITAGISVLHAHHLLHLDIKPGNLWLRPDDSVVILDLGASCLQTEGGILAPSILTPGFSAPEQQKRIGLERELSGPDTQPPLSEKTDIYGIATSMFACVTGRPPVDVQIRMKEVDAHGSFMGKSLRRSHNGHRSIRLLSLIDWGMQLDPDLRPGSLDAVRKELDQMPRLSTSVYQRTWLFRPPNIINANLE